MAFDSHANFATSFVATAPAPALTGLSLTVSAGQGALFPAAPFNCTVWPAGVSPISTNAEIIQVTAVVGDVFTIVRAQEGSTSRAITVGDQIANTTTVKVFTDIENSIIQSISAAGGAATAPMVQFDNSPTISFGIAGQTVTASAAAGGGSINFSAGTTSNNLSAVEFSNSNGVTFGINAGTITASISTNAGGGSVGVSAGTTSNLVGLINFFNANNISFGLVGGTITASKSDIPVAASASNGSFLFSTLGFSNANNVTFGTSAGSIITASVGAGAQSTQPVAASASNGSFLFSTLGFSNANGITFGTSAGSIITASVGSNPGQTTQPVAASASNGSFLFSTLAFSNANNVTFGTSAGSIITASVGAGAQSTQPVAASASNGSFLFSTLAFANANNVTFGTSAGSVVTASIPPQSNAFMQFYAQPLVGVGTNTTLSQNSMYVDFFTIQGPLRVSMMNYFWTCSASARSANPSTSGTMGFTQFYALYSRSVTDSAATNYSNSSNLSRFFSSSQTLAAAWTASSSSIGITYSWGTGTTNGSVSSSFSTVQTAFTQISVTGRKIFQAPFSTTLSQGEYWLAHRVQSTTSTAGNLDASRLLTVSHFHCVTDSNVSLGYFGQPNTSTLGYYYAQGYYSVTTNGFPASFAGSDITAQPHSQVYWQLQG